MSNREPIDPDFAFVAGGVWRFRNRDKMYDDLIQLGKEWNTKEPFSKGRHIDIFVRSCSGKQVGLGFKYEYDPRLVKSEQLMEEATDLLKRRFGNDFVGWDVDNRIFQISE